MNIIPLLFAVQALSQPNRFLVPEINYQVLQYDAKLTKQFGEGGGDMLCWPSSLAHRLTYFKNKNFPRLKLKAEAVENVPKLKTLCRTSLNGGTSQKRKIPCITEAFRESGYNIHTNWIGVDASKSQPVTSSDITEALKKGFAVILHVGWLRQDSDTKNWIEKGSHSVNAYGFEMVDDQLSLQITNPGVDYSTRAAGKMFDMVQLKESKNLNDSKLPKNAKLLLQGHGFDRPGRRAYIKNIFIFGNLPSKKGL